MSSFPQQGSEQTKNRKKEIIEAVLSILETHGIGGIRTARIAKIIGFSEAAIYKHFKSKNEILAYVLDERLKITKSNKKWVCHMEEGCEMCSG